MNPMTAIIHQSITMKEVCNHYGFTPNRAGFIVCPFHGEKTASLKIYPNTRGWHCFGCGKGGDVIDFIREYHSVGFQEAISAINTEFGLGMPEIKNLSYREREQLRKRTERLREQKAEEGRKSAEKQANYDYWLNEYILMDIIKRRLRPKDSDSELCTAYVYAMHRLPYIEYMLDIWG